MAESQNNLDTEIEFRNKDIQNHIRKNILISAFWQWLIVTLIFIGLPMVVVFLLRIDLLHPFITVGNAPILITTGIIYNILIVLQVIYSILYPKIKDKKSGKILGIIVIITMIVIPPIGTFVALMLVHDLKEQYNERNPSTEKSTPQENDLQRSIGKHLISSGILLLHQPLILIILNVILLGLPLDMARPYVNSDLYAPWDLVAYLYLGIYLLQIVFGILFLKREVSKLKLIISSIFGGFNITAMGWALGAFLTYLAPALEMGDLAPLLFLGGVLIGILINPIGYLFGKLTLRGIRIFFTLKTENKH